MPQTLPEELYLQKRVLDFSKIKVNLKSAKIILL